MAEFFLKILNLLLCVINSFFGGGGGGGGGDLESVILFVS